VLTMRRLCSGSFVPQSGSVAAAVMRVFVVSAFCSAVIIEMTDFLDESRRPSGGLFDLLRGALSIFGADAEWPDERSRSLQLYRLLIAVCSAIATCLFLLTRHQWASWGGALARVKAAAQFDFRHMILGLFGVMFLLVWDEYAFGRSETALYSERWTFLRIPIATSLAFAFACYAAAFRCVSNE
jgi:hypothetical protein